MEWLTNEKRMPASVLIFKPPWYYTTLTTPHAVVRVVHVAALHFPLAVVSKAVHVVWVQAALAVAVVVAKVDSAAVRRPLTVPTSEERAVVASARSSSRRLSSDLKFSSRVYEATLAAVKLAKPCFVQ